MAQDHIVRTHHVVIASLTQMVFPVRDQSVLP